MLCVTFWIRASAGDAANEKEDLHMAVLEINDLTVEFETDQGVVQAIDHLTLRIRPGEIVGLVGESGCGKTTVARCILGVVPRPPRVSAPGKSCFRGKTSCGCQKPR